MKQLYTLIIIFFAWSSLAAQADPKFPTTEEEYQKVYERNIIKTKINGVYIPGDEEEAFMQITKLSDPGAWDKFKEGPEELVVRNLKLGLGRWMVVNWNFYEGSRLSHYLRENGLTHPEDMSAYLLRYFHRKLNNVDLRIEDMISNLAEARLKLVQKDTSSIR